MDIYASINSRFPEQLAPLTLFFSIISILVATTLFFFSFLLGSFVVRRFIHQEKDWTLDKVLQQYSQLLAIPIFLTAIASFFAFFDSLRFTALLCVISIGIILLASLHIITRPSQASETDSFYQLFLSVLVNGVIILLFFVAEVALIEIIFVSWPFFKIHTLRKSNSNHVSFALPYSSTACG